jgi:uncharacterized protein (TIRG00374 family)
VNKRTLWNASKYLLAFGLLGGVVYVNWAPAGGKGLGYVWRRHVVEGEPVHGWFLLGGLLLYAVAALLTLPRWYVLVRALDLPFRFADALRLGLLGLFFNTFLPGSVGGDVVKAAAAAREQSRRTAAVASVVMDRLVALWGMFWLVALLGGTFWLSGGLGNADPAKQVLIVAWVVVAVTVVVWLSLGLLSAHRAARCAAQFGRLPKVGATVAELWRVAFLYRTRPRSVALALVLSWGSHAAVMLAFYCCARTLWDGEPGNPLPSLTQHFLLVPVGMLLMAAPLFPGGAGIGELGFGLLYRWFAYPEANGIVGSLLLRVLTWVVGLLSYAASTAFGAPVLVVQPHEVNPSGVDRREREAA